MQKEELAKKFIDAGYGKADIEEEDLEILGIKIPKTFKSKGGQTMEITSGWESFCAFVYEKVSGVPHPGCPFRGRGFRSQSYGKDVAEAIRNTIKGTVRVIECNAFGPQFVNLTPGSTHAVIDPPLGKNDDLGVWVMGEGEPVLLLGREFSFIEVNNEEQGE